MCFFFFFGGVVGAFTLLETNSSPLKMMVSNRNLLFQGVFSGVMLVSGRVSTLANC